MELEYFEIDIAKQKTLPYLQGERSLKVQSCKLKKHW